jgi:hypothetical protein
MQGSKKHHIPEPEQWTGKGVSSYLFLLVFLVADLKLRVAVIVVMIELHLNTTAGMKERTEENIKQRRCHEHWIMSPGHFEDLVRNLAEL